MMNLATWLSINELVKKKMFFLNEKEVCQGEKSRRAF